MRRKSGVLLSTASPVLAALIVAVADAGRVLAAAPASLTAQPAPAPAAGAIPAALAGDLAPQGAAILSGGTPLCNLWLLKSVPTVRSSDNSPDILYGNLQIGELVGVMQFLAPAQDFRHQKVPAGVYTLRYGQIPQDGNHMGVSQYRDFLLLCPAAADTNPDTALGFDQLVALSRKSLTTGHPAVMSLIPANSGVQTLPGAFNDDSGDQVVQFDLAEQGAASPVPVALVIVPGAQSGQQ
jgi:hypothetical protein